MTEQTDGPAPPADPPRTPDTGPPAASAAVRSENEAASRRRVDDLVSRSRVRHGRMAGRRADLRARRERDDPGSASRGTG